MLDSDQEVPHGDPDRWHPPSPDHLFNLRTAEVFSAFFIMIVFAPPARARRCRCRRRAAEERLAGCHRAAALRCAAGVGGLQLVLHCRSSRRDVLPRAHGEYRNHVGSDRSVQRGSRFAKLNACISPVAQECRILSACGGQRKIMECEGG